MRIGRALAMAWVLLAGSGCNMQRLAIRQMTPMLPEGIVAFEEESDYLFARDALAGQIKFLETLWRNDPTNRRLRLLLAQSYASYAFLFLEEDAQAQELDAPDAAEASYARAREFYRRAREYGMGELRRRKGFEEALAAGVGDEGIAVLNAHLRSYGRDDVPLLFWTANAWGSFVNMSRDDIEAVADAPRADALMQRALELDPSYYSAGPHLYFGMVNAVRPPALGGQPEEALRHFQAASTLTGGRFLLTDVLWARTYAVQVQDRDLYVQKLQHVLDAPPGLYPRQALANELAKRRAERLLRNVDEYF
jgi:hypothetical protein